MKTYKTVSLVDFLVLSTIPQFGELRLGSQVDRCHMDSGIWGLAAQKPPLFRCNVFKDRDFASSPSYRLLVCFKGALTLSSGSIAKNGRPLGLSGESLFDK